MKIDVDKIVGELAEELAADIDFGIISDLLVDSGWTKLSVDYVPPDRSWVVIKDWAEKNCKAQHQEHKGVWLFESAQDANWFILRWGN